MRQEKWRSQKVGKKLIFDWCWIFLFLSVLRGCSARWMVLGVPFVLRIWFSAFSMQINSPAGLVGWKGKLFFVWFTAHVGHIRTFWLFVRIGRFSPAFSAHISLQHSAASLLLSPSLFCVCSRFNIRYPIRPLFRLHIPPSLIPLPASVPLPAHIPLSTLTIHHIFPPHFSDGVWHLSRPSTSIFTPASTRL